MAVKHTIQFIGAKQCLFVPCMGRKNDWRQCGSVGIRTLISRSLENDDNIHVQLQSVLYRDGEKATVTCHKSCYSTYTSKSQKRVDNKRKAGDGPQLDEPLQRIHRSHVPGFVFQRECLFCGMMCMPKDPKHPGRW